MTGNQNTPAGQILVVDDQPGVRVTLQGILTKKGYQVAVAENGLRALELAKETPFRVVFMDIKMPGLSGVETYIKMKEINPNITVIMITGYAVEDDVKRAIQEGAYAIVYKPFDMTKILSILDDCLSDHHLIMVVDDHVADRQMVKQILWDKGYRVVEAATGEECLQKVREDRFQIILLDVKMPGMDGLETLKQVRALRPEVGVIMITGYSVEEMLQQAIQWGSFSCLRKPYEMDKLLDVVDQCLKQRPANKPTPHD